jgi:hypothetical protein
MILARSSVLSVAVLVLALAGCNQNTAETQAPDTAPAPVAQSEPAPAALPAEPAPVVVPPLTELPVNSVDSVMLSRPEDAPSAMIIRVLGTAASNGWSLPKLEPMIEEGSEASTVSYKFVATSPEASDDLNTAAEQIETEFRVDALPAGVTTIRIVSATNEVSAPVAQ